MRSTGERGGRRRIVFVRNRGRGMAISGLLFTEVNADNKILDPALRSPVNIHIVDLTSLKKLK